MPVGSAVNNEGGGGVVAHLKLGLEARGLVAELNLVVTELFWWRRLD